ncbi:tRNA (guanine-N(7)-)-methyltransferase non-catalytic subunit wdr4 [Dermacentor andersoni]|uniref:tRNA (guanine-N(7)-)-methyltransferase non-catalytic subunit wdr4 n=1 Tax=Dermacentor andersoni TaxID=34620 RepID=UPI003B3BAF73
MAFIRCMNNRIALVCVDLVYIYETKDGGSFSKVQLAIPEETGEYSGQHSEEEEDSKSSGKKDKQEEPGFSCANFSPCSTYFMAVTHSKRLVVWKRHSPGNWEAIFQRCVVRKCVQVRMCTTKDTILVADRSGDVYSFHFDDPEDSRGEAIIGRLSMVLDMIIGELDSFLAVSDRDEKIQVSCYPNCYNIRTFCLGHTQFVTCLALLPGPPELLVSGSGDGTIRTWCPETGRQLHRYDISIEKKVADSEGKVDTRAPAVKRIAVQPIGTTMACLIDGIPEVLLLGWLGPTAGWSRLQTLAVPCSPDDIAFDEDGHLWVALTSPPSVQLFALSSESNGCWQQREVPADLPSAGELPWAPLLKDVSWTLCQSLQSKPAATNGSCSSLTQLYKQWFDNEHSYLEKKRRRLEEAAAGTPKRAKLEPALS